MAPFSAAAASETFLGGLNGGVSPWVKCGCQRSKPAGLYGDGFLREPYKNFNDFNENIRGRMGGLLISTK